MKRNIELNIQTKSLYLMNCAVNTLYLIKRIKKNERKNANLSRKYGNSFFSLWTKKSIAFYVLCIWNFLLNYGFTFNHLLFVCEMNISMANESFFKNNNKYLVKEFDQQHENEKLLKKSKCYKRLDYIYNTYIMHTNVKWMHKVN